jgi:hypothetical protein
MYTQKPKKTDILVLPKQPCSQRHLFLGSKQSPKKFRSFAPQIHVGSLGEYVSKSIMLELAVLNKREREREESSMVERAHTRVLNK